MSGASAKNQRACPALNRGISSQQCGAERGTKIACPADCSFSPYAVANYSEAMVLTQRIVHKILDFIKATVDKQEMLELTRQAGLDGDERRKDPEGFFQHLVHYAMAFYRDANGESIGDRWRQKQFVGLTNDERVAAEAYCRSYVSALEVQQTGPEGHMKVVDLMGESAEPFLLIDRAASKNALRFSIFFAWFLPLPHYTRISGASGVEVPRETIASWKAEVDEALGTLRKKDPGLTAARFLATTYFQQGERMTQIGQERQKSLLQSMDFCLVIARFKINVAMADVEQILLNKPEMEPTEPAAGDGFDLPLKQFVWLRRGESKALEKDMIAPFQRSGSGEGVGVLATLRLYSDRVVLETMNRQKYAFARKLMSKWFGKALSFEAESIEDLAKMMVENVGTNKRIRPPSNQVSPVARFASGSGSDEARIKSHPEPMDGEAARVALQAFYRSRYEKFLDEPVPMLGNLTPREASREKKLRRPLIDLMKIHINGIDETNRKQGTEIDLDWLLEELGLSELRSKH